MPCRGIVVGKAWPLPPPTPPDVSKSSSKNEDQRPNDTSTSTNKSFACQESKDGGMRIVIADLWKRRMITVHSQSHDDQLDILLAQQYCLSLLTSTPHRLYFQGGGNCIFLTGGGLHHSE